MANNVLPKSDRLYQRMIEKERADQERQMKIHQNAHAKYGYGIKEDYMA